MRCFVITPYNEGDLLMCLPPEGADLILCADTAYRQASEAGLVPNVVIGDFDRESEPPIGIGRIVRVPSEKDDTDTMLCIKYAIEAGANEIVIAGGIGGRLDHTIANIQSLAYAASCGVAAVLTDGKNEARILSGRAKFPRKTGFYFSVFAYGGVCRGVSESGVKYPLRDVRLTPDFPLGVSNEITDDFAEIEVKEGRLLIIQSKREPQS